MAMQLPSSSSFSSVSNDFTYDVFISFRGSDTRYGFTGNLYKALSDKGIHTFIDDEELKRGDEITPSLLKSIEDSRIAIIVFSKDYASSSFCLDELVHIIHCSNEKGSTVIPVFYGTEPSHVRKLNDSYGEALAKHEQVFQNDKEDMERLKKWKKALNQAANLSGQHFNLGNEYESDFIQRIVTDVSYKINHVPFHVADYVVGLQSRILEVNSLLELGSNDGVCIIGILGTGGMGKTTLAQAVYNLIYNQFECKCFLHNVRENSVKYGLEYLQEQLLSESIGFEKKVGHFNQGITIIKERLCKKKVLLILDDVDNLKQLQVLVREPGWLGDGSKVIITTRDKHLLSCHGIKEIYEADGLNKKQALEVLRKVAFKSNKNDSSYDSILNRAAKYASGLPLALEVVGSNLSGRSIEECESLLDKYERIPHEDILKILKVSFDALDEEQQSVFLDIACFFKGDTLAYVEKMLHIRYGHCKKIHLRELVDKSLIKINTHWRYDDVTLHDLIEDMGKEVVRQESPNKPGERSRLWFDDDIVLVLKENMGTANIEMIYLKCPSMKHVIESNEKAFEKMTNLKILIIKEGNFSRVPEYLPSCLRFLEWSGCPLKSLSSCISNKDFKHMKVLTLNNCEYLTHIADVSGLRNLEEFSFQYCHSLITIDNSVGHLDKLEILDASDCNKIESFPPLRLPSLKKLNLSKCKSLKSFPELLCKMTNIKEIELCDTSIQELPFSFQNLSELCRLKIHSENFKILPECLSECHLLSVLHLDYCKSLEEIRGIPPNLKKISAMGCKSLSSSSRRMLLSQKLHEAGGTDFIFENKTEPIGIPDWFEHQSSGRTISFWFRKKIPSITFIHLLPGFKGVLKIILFVNRYDFSEYLGKMISMELDTEHAILFDLKLEEHFKKIQGYHVSKMDKALLENEWIHVELSLEKYYWSSFRVEDACSVTEENGIREDDFSDTEEIDISEDDFSETVENDFSDTVQNDISVDDFCDTVENDFSDTVENDFSDTVQNDISVDDFCDTVENDFSDTVENDFSDTVQNDISVDDFCDTLENDFSDTVENNISEDDFSDTVENDFGDTVENDISEDDISDTVVIDISEDDFSDTVENDFSEKVENDFSDTMENDISEDDFSDMVENDISDTVKIKLLLRSARMGIHVLKEKSNTEEDVIFSSRYRKRKLDGYLNYSTNHYRKYSNTSLSEFEPPLKKQRLVEVGAKKTNTMARFLGSGNHL